MFFDMTYDGQIITWPGRRAFKATSGLAGFQLPKNSCVPNSGPIPEGLYKVYISDHGIAQDDGTGYCSLKPSCGGFRKYLEVPQQEAANHIGKIGVGTGQEWNPQTIPPRTGVLL
jgi:hypothetical protein